MRYMIDTRTISRDRPSQQEMELNRWKLNEMSLMGLVVAYDSSSKNASKIELTEFSSQSKYQKALMYAMEQLDEYKPVPEPLRTKLINEAENYRKHGRYSCIL